MDVGIDGYNLALPHGTGVATFAQTLARTLHRAGHGTVGVYGIDPGRDPLLRETLFFEQLGRPAKPTPEQYRRATRQRLLRALQPWLSIRARDIPLTHSVTREPLSERLPPFDRIVSYDDLFALAMRHFRIYGRFLRLRCSHPPQVMHWTYPLPIEMVGARNIYTLHDIVPLRLPYTTLENKSRYRALIAGCLAKAAAICTVSEASKADILSEFGGDPDHIVTTWQASPMTHSSAPGDIESDADTVRGVFGLEPQSYFLYLGAIEPKKNIGRLLQAFLSLQTPTPLVLTGGREWQSKDELMALPDIFSASGEHAARVRRVGHVPHNLLRKLIQCARAVLFPSLYEGFGLPVLEAMQLGTPVLTSNRSSLPEVAGDAALLIDPYDIAALAHGIAALDTDSALRARLSEAGLREAVRFSEAAYLTRLEALYARAMAAPQR